VKISLTLGPSGVPGFDQDLPIITLGKNPLRISTVFEAYKISASVTLDSLDYY
jgi:hypothetical protein